MKMLVEDVRLLHGPSAAIIVSAGLLVPAVRPGLPPVATRYTSAPCGGQMYWFVRVKKPAGSVFRLLATLAFPSVALLLPSLVVAVVRINGVAALPSPVVPTAYNCSVAPVTGCWPPWTAPAIFSVFTAGVTGAVAQPLTRATRSTVENDHIRFCCNTRMPVARKLNFIGENSSTK